MLSYKERKEGFNRTETDWFSEKMEQNNPDLSILNKYTLPWRVYMKKSNVKMKPLPATVALAVLDKLSVQ